MNSRSASEGDQAVLRRGIRARELGPLAAGVLGARRDAGVAVARAGPPRAAGARVRRQPRARAARGRRAGGLLRQGMFYFYSLSRLSADWFIRNYTHSSPLQIMSS